MNTLPQQLAAYAAYHRDWRNIATHFVGIPAIVLSSASLLSRPAWPVAGLMLSPAVALAGLLALYYLRLDRRFGLLMTLLLGLVLVAAANMAALPLAQWLWLSVGGFVLGWVFQLVGHVWEGRKPAFVDDISGLAIGPLFIVFELLVLLGACRQLARQVKAMHTPPAGPV
ncbi:membrane protein [Aquitalea magnusonii]|nr:membrane protein [Aquitalea magnusonii]